MSPVALGLALAVHGLAIAAVWWMSPFRPPEPPEDAIMVTVHSRVPSTSPDPPAADRPAEPTVAATSKPPPPDPTPKEQPREEPQQAMAAPEPPRPQPAQPEPPRPEPPRSEAAAPPRPPQSAPPQSPPSSPSLEEALASPQELPPPTAHDVPTIRVPLPPWPSPRPPQAAQPPPPRPPQLAVAPPPANAPASVQAPPSNSTDWLLGKTRARNAYLDQVARLTSKFRRYPRGLVDANQQGRVVTRVTLARDGRLIDVSIDTSSGWPAIDAAELETIRRSAPFPPVPADMPGDPLILILPINFLALR